MLSVAVNTLRYVLEMRGWDGITIPMIHAVGDFHRFPVTQLPPSLSLDPTPLSQPRVAADR
jgi:hypothetical protein